MKQHWLYLKAVCRHKWFVFLACLQFDIPLWTALWHDIDKFLPQMWTPYARYFYGAWRGPNLDRNVEAPPDVYLPFEYAWNWHQKRWGHHWQHWVRIGDDGTILALAMPDRHRREMLADWFGAGRAYLKDWTPLEPRKWYEKNKDKMKLHPDTRAWVEAELLRRETEYQDEIRFRAILGM